MSEPVFLNAVRGPEASRGPDQLDRALRSLELEVYESFVRLGGKLGAMTLYADEANARIGIGVQSPAATLDVAGDENPTVRIGSTGTVTRLRIVDFGSVTPREWDVRNNAGAFQVRDNTAGTTPLTVAGAAPGDALSVRSNGNVLFSYMDSRVSADFAKTASTALANVTGLTFNVEAGRTYGFEARLYYDANATGGQKYAISGTATATAVIYHIKSLRDSTNAYVITSRQTALGGSAGQAGATAGFCQIHGTITVNAGGTLTVQFAQNVASGTSTILRGSTFHLWEIA